jgi:hypothetical protein
MNSISKAVIAIVMGTALSQAAMAEVCYTTGSYDQAYVPCVSSVDEGNGHWVVYDSEGTVINQGWSGGNSNNNNNGCFAYNRDGRTCSDVGFSEGQTGAPWGQGAGQFRCTSGCLQFVGQ